MGRRGVPGTVYLIHFEAPYRHARHYLGWTERPLELRIGEHRIGQGSRLLEVITAAGIDWRLARVWTNVTRRFERQLKQHGSTRICPVCHPETAHRRHAKETACRSSPK